MRARVRKRHALGGVGGGAARVAPRELARFGALSDLLKAIDRFVLDELRPRVPRLAGVVERTDAMMAVYPGGGSRFQSHVDNTTQDGRRLAVLCYLSSRGWARGDGGAAALAARRRAAAARPRRRGRSTFCPRAGGSRCSGPTRCRTRSGPRTRAGSR